MREPELAWLRPTLRSFRQMLDDDRFPHAVMITGPEGVGKSNLARDLAALLLCNAGEAQPCDRCQACVLFNAGNHPDFYEIAPLEDKNSLGIEQIRALSADLNLTAGLGARRVAIIQPADLMTRAAANSLLKTLEEPPRGTVLVLVTARPARLPATVRSRCQLTRQPSPSAELALAWLKEQDADVDWRTLLRLAGGAPLKALAMNGDGLGDLDSTLARDVWTLVSGSRSPLTVAENWKKAGAGRCLEWLHGSVLAMARSRAVSVDLSSDLQKAGENINLDRLLAYADGLAKARALLETPANELLVLESALIPWTRGLDSDSNLQQAVTL